MRRAPNLRQNVPRDVGLRITSFPTEISRGLVFADPCFEEVLLVVNSENLTMDLSGESRNEDDVLRAPHGVARVLPDPLVRMLGAVHTHPSEP